MPDATAVLLGPRDLVVAAARRLDLHVVVVVDSDTAAPSDTEFRTIRCPWTSHPHVLVDRLRTLEPELGTTVSCFGFGEVGSVVAAHVNEALNWPGNPPGALETFKDKARLRARVGDRAGAPVAYAVCSTEEELVRAVERTGLPCVVKPVDGTGSSGVRRLDTAEQVRQHAGRLEPGVPQLVEEFLVGREFSVEAMSTPAGHRIMALTEKTTTGAPHFVETGHTLPTVTHPSEEAAVCQVVLAALDAVDYRYGPSHTEIMLTAEGPRLIESHGRPGGDRISDMLALALGEDVFAQAMAATLGVPCPSGPTTGRVAGIRYLDFDPSTPMPLVPAEAAAELPGVVEVCVSPSPGELPRPVRRSADRHGFVLAVAGSRGELEAVLTEALDTLSAPTSRQTPCGSTMPDTQAASFVAPARPVVSGRVRSSSTRA
ncbi:ATP-grasp domain-containing protein [Streptomyces sp. NBC_00059]|uniref:ATP-grasp domain-containing protein n=1 Tax=Streptomyces sp. NBC_00059 TaxID=2975635 RepID=UPI0022554DDF|nr:ATP-grasp domain-containing protein [Streptomyces sp. NBC_00059]MCX5416802.1 ATP-grasp domain-containing protein [Streptomyces sp. NBC_00059]